MSKHDDDEIQQLAEDFCDEDFDPDFLKSFTPEEAAEIKQALALLGKYKENYPDEVKSALQELARIAVSAPEDQDQDQDDEDDEDEDDEKKKLKKKSPRWSFSFAKIDADPDADDDAEDLDDAEVEELIENVAADFKIIDDLLKTSCLLGLEFAKTKGNKEIEEKLDELNATIQKIARAQGVKKSSGDNDNDKKWGFSLVRHLTPDEDEE